MRRNRANQRHSATGMTPRDIIWSRHETMNYDEHAKPSESPRAAAAEAKRERRRQRNRRVSDG